MNAAGSNNLLRLKEILDANPEQVPFFFIPLVLQIVFTSLKSFINQSKMRNMNIR